MSTSLSANLFGNVLQRKQKQKRGRSLTPRSSMAEVFVSMECISYLQTSSNLDDGGIVELPLYLSIFSFHDKTGSMGENKDPENSHISHTGIFFFSLCEEYNLLLPLLRNGCSLIYQFVFWRSNKVVFESIPFFFEIFDLIVKVFKTLIFAISKH